MFVVCGRCLVLFCRLVCFIINPFFLVLLLVSEFVFFLLRVTSSDKFITLIPFLPAESTLQPEGFFH